MQSKATTVAAYLRSLPAERRAEIEKVRAVINANLDRQYEERMSYGMIAWVVPHSVFPGGYHCDPAQPLPFAGLASQKNHCSVYVPLVVPSRVVDQTPDGELHRWFAEAWRKTGRKLDMGKCCIRFRRAEELALDVLGELIRRRPAKAFVADYLAALGPKELAKVQKAAAGRPVKRAAASSRSAAKTRKAAR